MEAQRLQDDDHPESARHADERALLAAIRRGEERAIERFHATYELRLIDIARNLGVPLGERENAVLEFLSVSVESLFASRVIPRSLAAYVTASFCNFIKDRQRAESTRRERESDACSDVGESGERVALDSCSEYSARMAAGGAAPEAASRGVRRRLVGAVLDSLSDGDRELLRYRAKLSLRESAELAGLTYGNAKVRMYRIRANALIVARNLVRELPERDRAELAGFLRRSGLFAEEGLEE